MSDTSKRTMITINLLPAERRRMSMDWAPKLLAGLAVITVVGAVLAINVYYVYRTQALKSMRVDLQRQLVQMQDEVAGVREMETEINILHRKERVINDLVVNRIEWARKLNQLSDIMPQRVWLEQLALEMEKSQTGAKTGPPRKVLRIVGVTRALEHARSLEAALIYNIMRSPFMEHFETVQLMDSGLREWQNDREIKVWRFELQLPLKQKPAPAAPQAPAAAGTGGQPA